MNLGRLALLSLFTASALIACASESDEGSAADEVNSGGKISGFDLDGPKTLPKREAGICPAVVSPVQQACSAARGTPLRSGCQHLCSIPIAPKDKAAGYAFDGYKQLPSGNAAVTFCAQVLSEEDAACERVHGTMNAADDCAALCSKPIAPRGQVAGYDLTGFKTLPDDKVPVEFCATVLSPVDQACLAVGGDRTPVKSCKGLCSLPL